MKVAILIGFGKNRTGTGLRLKNFICKCPLRLGLVFAFSVASASACGPAMLHEERVGELGRMDFHKPENDLQGVVIGVPFGLNEPDAVEYARRMSEKLGTGLVIAYGFSSKRVIVEQPLVLTAPIAAPMGNVRAPGSVYREFHALLPAAADGPLKFYAGIRVAEENIGPDRIDVATSGLTFEQLQALKQAYLGVRDDLLASRAVRRFQMALNPLDSISWNVTGVKNYGVLMAAKKGVVLRLPHSFTEPEIEEAYGTILTRWMGEAISMATQNPSHLPEVEVKQTGYGRIDTLPPRKDLRGVVVGAPHGSFDGYTAELVEEISYRTALPGVVARGFTPTEAGGWRINVNRPTEKSFPMGRPGEEKNTERARAVFEEFAGTILRAARGRLQLYFDFHQNGEEPNINVATVGITAAQASAIKNAYGKIRDRWLAASKNAVSVDMVIEPIDKVTFVATVSKQQGILHMAKRAFQFEMPAHRVFYRRETRRVYSAIMAELVEAITALTMGPAATATRDDMKGINTVLVSRTTKKSR